MTPDAASGQQAPGRGIKPLVSLRNHAGAGALAALLVWLVGVPAALLRLKPLWRSEAQVYVSSRFVKNLQGDQELELPSYTMYRDFVQQQTKTITRYDVVLGALQRLGDRASLWQRPGESPRRAAERLAAALEVAPITGTYLITVGLTRTEPQGLDAIVNAVVESYVAASREETVYAGDQRVATLKRRRDELRTEVESKAAARNQLAEELGTTSFDDTKQSAFDRLLVDAEVALAEAQRRRIAAEEHLATFEPSRPEGAATLRAAAEEALVADPALSSAKSRLAERRTALLTQMSGLRPEHPGRQAIEKELAALESELERLGSSALRLREQALLEQRRAEAGEARRVERQLAADLRERRSRASDLARKTSEASHLSADIARARAQLVQIDNRIDFLVVEAEAPGWVRVVTTARPPEVPSGLSRRNGAVLVLLAGLAAGLLLPLGIDLLDRRVHAPNDVERLLRIPPSGWLVEREDDATREYAVDQLLRLATTITREAAGGQRRFLLTSVDAGGGTTTLALELGRALHQSGQRVLVVEANAFRPDPRFGTGPGLAEALRGEARLDGVVLPASADLPARVPVGRPAGRHLAGLEGFGTWLEAAGVGRDVVLIDAPPVLLSADVERLAAAGPGVLLVVEAEGPWPGHIRRAVRAVERLAPPLFGVLVNRVRVYEGGGYLADLLREYRSGGRTAGSSGAFGRLAPLLQRVGALLARRLPGGRR